jgi:hypothetical protein
MDADRMTRGRAAYEAYAYQMRIDRGWHDLSDAERGSWQAAGVAALEHGPPDAMLPGEEVRLAWAVDEAWYLRVEVGQYLLDSRLAMIRVGTGREWVAVRALMAPARAMATALRDAVREALAEQSRREVQDGR